MVGAGWHININPAFTIFREDGKACRFEWHPYLGPTFLRADGEPRSAFPCQRNPVWRAYSLWEAQGRRMTPDGVCIWEGPLTHMGANIYPMPGCKRPVIHRLRDTPAGWDVLENVR